MPMMRRRRRRRRVVATAAVVHHHDERIRSEEEQQQAAQYDEPAPAAAPESDLTAQLQNLADMHDSGALSDEEFADAKAKLLAS